MTDEGGIIGPIQEDAAVIAAENFRSYPAFFMAGINIEPIAAVSATALPVIPAKKTLARMLAWPNPPRTCPTSVVEKLTNRLVIAVLFIISPARIKRGIAINGNKSHPL